MRGWGAAVIAGLALAGPAAAQGRADFTEADNGRAVRLYSPQFTVELPRNAGTGYHWEFGSRNSRGVQLVSKGGGRSAPHPSGYVGYGQTDRFTLRATAPEGEVRIGLLPPGRYDGPERVFRMTFRSAYADRGTSGRYDSPQRGEDYGPGPGRYPGYTQPQGGYYTPPQTPYSTPQGGDYAQPRPRPYGYYPPG